MPASEEKRLVVRAMGGDAEASDRLARACRPWLLRCCLQLCGDQERAQDLVQETLCRGLGALAQLQEPAYFRAWLGRIALNLHRTHCRRTARAAETLLPPERVAEIPCRAWPEPTGLREALSRLGVTNRELLLLFHGQGLSYRELAQRLALSPAAVKARLHRAREQMRQELLGASAPVPPRLPSR